jgi:acyl dehydratase
MKGLYFEAMTVGRVYRHSVTRTVTEMDNVLFSCLTMNPQPLHLDEEYSRNTMYGTRIVNGLFTLALTVSVGISEMTMGTMLGNLSYDKIDFPHPVLHGDTLRGETLILKKKLSKSHPEAGIVWFEHRSFNQKGELACRCVRAALVRRSPTALRRERLVLAAKKKALVSSTRRVAKTPGRRTSARA